MDDSFMPNPELPDGPPAGGGGPGGGGDDVLPELFGFGLASTPPPRAIAASPGFRYRWT
ncbi:hypothetical protein GCM10027184_34600 [Saccharothrix stipae]